MIEVHTDTHPESEPAAPAPEPAGETRRPGFTPEDQAILHDPHRSDYERAHALVNRRQQ